MGEAGRDECGAGAGGGVAATPRIILIILKVFTGFLTAGGRGLRYTRLHMRKWWVGSLLIGVLGLGVGIGGGIMIATRSQEPGTSTDNITQDNVLGIIEPSPTPSTCSFTMAGVGDVMLGRSVMDQMEKRNDWTWPFASVGGRLAAADLTVGNLEAPIVTGCYQKENRFILCTKPEAVLGLEQAGFDALSLANNHMYNWGQDGFVETVTVLERANMAGVTDELVGFKEVCGIQVAFMGLDDVSAPLDLEAVAEQVLVVADSAEVTVALVHWGVEYEDAPRPRQREVADVLASAGVDVILGAHPHWVQPVEYVGKTLVFWSLGNFVFDQMWSEETRRGEMAEVRFTIYDSRMTAMDYDLIPVRIYDYGQPRVVEVNSE